MSKSRFSPKSIAISGIIAALYAVMAYFSSVFGIAYGPIQCRFSEALCVLPFLTPAAVPGLFLGCLVSNLLSPYGALDIVFGSIATLLAAIWTGRVRRKWLAPLPPVVCNAVIVGGVIAFAMTGFGPGFWVAYAINAASVGVGEFVVCFVLGDLLLDAVVKIPVFRNMMPADRVALMKKG